jgi:hypothetical protein
MVDPFRIRNPIQFEEKNVAEILRCEGGVEYITKQLNNALSDEKIKENLYVEILQKLETAQIQINNQTEIINTQESIISKQHEVIEYYKNSIKELLLGNIFNFQFNLN